MKNEMNGDPLLLFQTFARKGRTMASLKEWAKIDNRLEIIWKQFETWAARMQTDASLSRQSFGLQDIQQPTFLKMLSELQQLDFSHFELSFGATYLQADSVNFGIVRFELTDSLSRGTLDATTVTTQSFSKDYCSQTNPSLWWTERHGDKNQYFDALNAFYAEIEEVLTAKIKGLQAMPLFQTRTAFSSPLSGSWMKRTNSVA